MNDHGLTVEDVPRSTVRSTLGDEGLSVTEYARTIAADFGLAPDDEHLEWVIWEFTGYPSFFDGDPILTFTRQLRRYFAELEADIYPADRYFPTDAPFDPVGAY